MFVIFIYCTFMDAFSAQMHSNTYWSLEEAKAVASELAKDYAKGNSDYYFIAVHELRDGDAVFAIAKEE